MDLRLAEIARRPTSVLFLVLLVTLAALYFASRLRVRTDLVSLLPVGSPAADDYRVFLERFGGLEQVFVLILPAAADTEASDLARAASVLEEILADSPEVEHARAGLETRDAEFFSRWIAPRAPLLLGDEWRRVVTRRIEPAAISKRVAWLRATLSTPAGAFQTFLAKSDPLGFTEELQLTTTAQPIGLDPFTSTFQSETGDAALVLLTPSRSEMDPEGGRALAAELETAYAEVRRRLEVELEFQALGGPLYAAQDETLLRRDLERTLTASLLMTSALLILAFGGWRMPLTIVIPLLIGLLWAAAVIVLIRGEIFAISMGFGAILVGLGIDYGIHGGTRFRQTYLAAGDGDAVGAFRSTIHHVGPPIVTSAVTTAGGFAVLGFAHLPPLRELGLLVTLGILAILLAMGVAGGAAWVLVAPRLRQPGAAWSWLGRIGDLLPGIATRRPKLVLAGAALATVAAIPSVMYLSVDADVRTMRPDDHPALEAEERLVEHFGIGLDTATVVVRGSDLPGTLVAAGGVAHVLRQELPGAAVSSPADLVALGEPVQDRLRELAALPLERAAAHLERELAAANLDPRAFDRGIQALRTLGRGEDPGAPPVDAWPDWLRRSVRRDDDGVWAAVNLRLPPDTWPEGPPPALVERIRTLAPEAAIASAVAIGAELRSLAVEDLRALGLLALAVVAGVVAISFRGRLGDSALAGLPVILGSLWTLGLWAALDRPLDLFTLAVLPILLGVGIDDGLHVIHGAHTDPEAGIRGSVRASCRALTLTTLTTCAGFGSLVLSSIPGLRNGGALIAVGVFTCLLATLLVLPALEAVRRPSGATTP